MTTEKNTRQNVTVTKNQAHFNSLKWLSKGLSKDATRPSLHFLCCEVEDDDVILVTTDGRRLHKLETNIGILPGLETGGYSIKISAREILLAPETFEKVGNFPKWRQVMPDYDDHPEQEEVIRETVQVEKNNVSSKATAVLNAANPGKEPILYGDQFLCDAMGQGTLFGANGKALWRCETVENNPLMMTLDKGENLVAVVMPMRVT
jgi:hypothetical protein